MVKLVARSASLQDMAMLLREQHARKLDVVVSPQTVAARDGQIVVSGLEPILTDDGVVTPTKVYTPTDVFDQGVASKLRIPLAYLRRMRDERVWMYDENVNGWLRGKSSIRRSPETQNLETVWLAEPDPRKFMLRLFTVPDGQNGVARAFLSDSYKRIDNLDVLTAVLDGVRSSGVETEVQGCDLSPGRMYVRLYCPEVAARAPELLRGYRSPFNGRSAEELPLVFAGFVASNSEVGAGAFSLTPRVVFQVCDNGLTITKDAIRSVHLGGRLDEGQIRWSDDTQQTNLELVSKMTRDAVQTFLSQEYVEGVVADMAEKGTKEVVGPAETIKEVGSALKYTQAQIDGVLDHFIRGGQMTAGGLVNAVTSFAQLVGDADAASSLEDSAIRVLDLV